MGGSIQLAVINLWNKLNKCNDGVLDSKDNLDDAIRKELGLNNENDSLNFNEFVEDFEDIHARLVGKLPKGEKPSLELQEDENSDDLVADFNRTRERLRNNFENIKKRNEDDFKITEAENKAKMEAFQFDANNKFLKITEDNKNIKKDFRIQSMYIILEDLKNGYSGGIVANDGAIVIKYDTNNNVFVLREKNKEIVLTDDSLAAKINDIAENAYNISGKSQKSSI